MREPGQGEARSFGRRTGSPVGAASEPPRPDVTWERIQDEPERGPSPVAWALRTAGLVLFLALLATQYLSGLSGTGSIRLARGPHPDPETTGSIGSAARAQRLDPCAVSAQRPRP